MKGLRFGICEWCLPEVGPYVCRLAADAGLDGVSLDMGTRKGGLRLADPRIRRFYMEEAQRSGVEYCAIALNVFGEGCTLLHPEDARERELACRVLDEAVAAAAEMSVSLLQVPSFYGNAMANREDMEASAFYFRYACERAEARGVTIATENTLSADAQEELLALVDRPNFGLCFDTQNAVFFGGDDPVAMARRLAGSIRQIHVKDGTEAGLGNRAFGQGHARIDECLTAIREIGYEGWIVLENNYAGWLTEALPSLQADLKRVRQAFEASV